MAGRRRVHVGKIKYRDQHRAEDRANTSDRGGGAEHMADMLRQGALAAPERIRSKNERLSAQSFTRRYEVVRDIVTDRAPRAFKEQASSTRIKTSGERAHEPRKGRPQRASEPNTKPGGVRVVCALRFFLRAKSIFKGILWCHPSSLVVLHRHR